LQNGDNLVRNTLNAIFSQVLTYDDDSKLAKVIFLIAADLQFLILAKEAMNRSSQLNFKESLYFFSKTDGEYRYMVLLKADPKFLGNIKTALKPNSKIVPLVLKNIEYDKSAIKSFVATLCRKISFAELVTLHKKLEIDVESDILVSEFICALEAANLDVCKNISNNGFRVQVDGESVVHMLFALSGNKDNDSNVKLWGEILAFVFALNVNLRIDPLDTIDLLATPFFHDHSTRVVMLMERTNWKTPITPSITRSYHILNDETLTRALLTNGTLDYWANLVVRPKFRVFPHVTVNAKVMSILHDFDLILN
jgi:hypothetical protein